MRKEIGTIHAWPSTPQAHQYGISIQIKIQSGLEK